MSTPASRYAVAERERRFLLAAVPPDLPAGLLVQDAYLVGTGLRRRTVTAPDGSVLRKLGHKVREGDTVWHTSIYPDDAGWRHLATLGGVALTKRRHLVGADPVVAVDVFTGLLAGLVLAEVDRGDAPDRDDLPQRLAELGLDVVREVTDDDAWTGGALAVRGAPVVLPAATDVRVRPFTDADWAAFEPVFREVVEAGETYALPADADARASWTGEHVVVAEGPDGTLLGSARTGPDRAAQGAHVGTASFMVAPAAQGLGVGRALGAHVVQWHRDQGYRGIRFNAVVETNLAAVRLWQALGFTIVGTVPGAFRRPTGEHVGLHVMHLDLTVTS